MAEDRKSMVSGPNCLEQNAPTTTYGNGHRASITIFRYPTLAELSTIATSCSDMNTATNQVNQGKCCANSNTRNASASVDTLSGSWAKPHIPATPPKCDVFISTETRPAEDPVTPTANLKMLVSAASPAIRDREIKKRELFPMGSHVASYLPSFGSSNYTSNAASVSATANNSERVTVSRKDKSLGLLCQRFLAKYPEYPPTHQVIEISLDEVAKDLNVERRRIYDIVNVLESVEVISRHAKNRYTWHGKTRLCHTLTKLKRYAVSQCMGVKGTTANPEMKSTETAARKDKKRNCVVSKSLPRLLPKNTNVENSRRPLDSCVAQNLTLKELVAMGQENHLYNQDENTRVKKSREVDYCRKDKSLGVLSQKFLMMFLVSETRHVTLEEAANLLIDEDEHGQAKYKTKVRRLYDIANILSSLQLIEKVHIHSIQSGRKPGFRWIGLDLDELDNENIEDNKQLQEPPPVKRMCASKNSVLDESAVGRLISRRPSQQQLQRNKTEKGSTTKLPRSRSHQVLGSKRRALKEGEDGFSLQELAGSPTEQKFRADLKKLHDQYPDRMSQLLSVCREHFPSESKTSRRSLFIKSNATDDGPETKRSKPEDPSAAKGTQFEHSSTSPFKVVQGSCSEASGQTDEKITETPDDSKQGSPEHKVLLERQKQQELLNEQRDFDLQDERWKRSERELDKAFATCQPTVSNASGFPVMVHQSSSPLPLDLLIEQSSVGIQASLVEDLSPLKPPSYYRNALPRNQATPSPVPSQNGVVPSPPMRPPWPSVARRVMGQLPLQVPQSSGNLALIRVTPPSGQSTPSPNPLVKAPGQLFNSPALYSPRSLTPTPTGDVLQPPTCSPLANVVPGNCNTPVTQLQPCGSETDETPMATSQLLFDVSKRLSLPQS